MAPVMSDPIAPMLATLGPAPRGGGWAYEYKWDGVRAVTYAGGASVRALSRNHRDVTAAYPELGETAELLGGRTAVLDGEIVALDPAGRPSFARLQRRMHVREPAAGLVAEVPVAYYVFDVLALDGEPVLARPYADRRALLTGLGLTGRAVDTPAAITGADPEEVLAAAGRRGLEGIVAKRLGSPYRPGRRSPDWVKTPFNRTQEVVIVGYKPGGGRRSGTLGSLVLAVSDPGGGLSFAGGVGTGFTAEALRRLGQQLARWHRSTPPLSDVPREHARGVQWVEAVLVGEVSYRNWTPDGRLRHPSWRGLRPDRTPDEARRPAAPSPPPEARARVDGVMQTPDGRWRVEIMRRGDARWYRVQHAGNEFDWLDLAGVERVLSGAGVDLSMLTAGDRPEPAGGRDAVGPR